LYTGGKGRLVGASLARISEAKDGRMEGSLVRIPVAKVGWFGPVLHVYRKQRTVEWRSVLPLYREQVSLDLGQSCTYINSKTRLDAIILVHILAGKVG
jgi:hypothetical protein